ncbi:replication-relaxation family protein [Streptomyces avermitilis]|uniref:replication-relaxation family protein n=1 Tax=Streptomyces avermitilis TaxID=33903 RepID=UPI0036823F30
MGGSQTYPYGSTAAVRDHVLAALGVLKVATADQVRRLMCPGHKDNKAVRNAALDLARHGLTVSEGNTRDGQKLWGLTLLGLDAAAEVLGRPTGEMGGAARGAARSGAPHAMAVNETVIAITRTAPQPARSVRPAAPPAPPAAPVPAVPAGVGTAASWWTEVAHNLPTAARTRVGVRADAVLHAPEAGLPVLLVEVDRGTESDDVLAAKFEKYRRFFRLKGKDHRGHGVPLWRSLYPSTGREGHPPLLVVFDPGTRLGEQALKNRMDRVMDLAREHWSGSYKSMGSHNQAPDGYYDAIPLLFTILERLQTHGPHAGVWWRCGHGQGEALPDALANPQDIEAWHQRDEHRRRPTNKKDSRRRPQRRGVSGPPPSPHPRRCPRRFRVRAADSRSACPTFPSRLPRTAGTAPHAAWTWPSNPRGLIKAFLQRRP